MTHHTKDSLLQHIRDYVENNGRIPSTSHTGQSCLPHSSIYVRTFGSWREALHLAGFGVRTEVEQQQYALNPTLCRGCSRSLSFPNRNNKYCSKSCAASINNSITPKKARQNTCKQCSNPIVTSLRYCSDNCKHLYRETLRTKRMTPIASNVEHVRQVRLRTKQRAVAYKGGKCVMCDYTRCNRALTFHHLDPDQKDFTIGGQGTRGWNHIQSELDKCILLCCRCHTELHDGVITLEEINARIGVEPISDTL